jgi:hypothetical protein
VDHESYVLLVDTHAESDCSDNNVDFSFHPSSLNFLSLAVREFSMVVVARDLVVNAQGFRQLLTVLTTQTVDYTGLLLEARFKQVNYVRVNRFELLAVSNLVGQVGPVKGRLEVVYVVFDP